MWQTLGSSGPRLWFEWLLVDIEHQHGIVSVIG